MSCPLSCSPTPGEQRFLSLQRMKDACVPASAGVGDTEVCAAAEALEACEMFLQLLGSLVAGRGGTVVAEEM